MPEWDAGAFDKRENEMEGILNITQDAITQDDITKQSGGLLKYIGVGLAVALSGTLLKWFQGTGDVPILVSLMVHILIVLIPAATTYYLLSKTQETKIVQIIEALDSVSNSLKQLKRVSEIEKHYIANDQIIELERRIITETAGTMQEVAEIASEFNDNNSPIQVRLKERLKTHAKSILTFHNTFKVAVENNLKKIAEIEHEYTEIPHSERNDLIHQTGEDRVNKIYGRHGLNGVIEDLDRIGKLSIEMGKMAENEHRHVIDTLDGKQLLEGN